MAATPYRPISWTDQSLTKEKLQQMANNDQWLFENSPRMRYNYQGGIVKDNGLKVIVGKTAYASTGRDWVDVPVYFGGFFSAACKPIVTATVESANRIDVTINGLDGVEIDYRGFRGHVWLDIIPGLASAPVPNGWLHWQAVGF